MEAADYALAFSIAQAVEADAALIAALLQEDEQAERDRNFAQLLEQDQGVEPASPPRENTAQDGQLDDETFDALRLFNIPPPETGAVSPVVDDTTIASDDVDVEMSEDNKINDGQKHLDPSPGQDHDTDQNINHDEGPGVEPESEALPEEAPGPEPSTEAATLAEEEPVIDAEAEPEQVESPTGIPVIIATAPSPTASLPETTECIYCTDELPRSELFEAPCSHSICRTCLANWMQTSLRDESSFPLKCCGQIIPIALDNHLISEEQFDLYEARRNELETSAPTYCSDATCAVFIPLRSIEAGIARCLHCERQTCVECKIEMHTGLCTKSQDDQTQEVLAMAEVAGWRRCAQCHHMVSLATGCNHISCRCGFEFCYVCGERWKTCQCPHFDEANLLNRADEIAAARQRVVRNVILPARNIIPPARNIVLPARPLVCRHREVRRVQGEHRCDQCNYVLWEFILNCLDCGLDVCYRCSNIQ